MDLLLMRALLLVGFSSTASGSRWLSRVVPVVRLVMLAVVSSKFRLSNFEDKRVGFGDCFTAMDMDSFGWIGWFGV